MTAINAPSCPLALIPAPYTTFTQQVLQVLPLPAPQRHVNAEAGGKQAPHMQAGRPAVACDRMA